MKSLSEETERQTRDPVYTCSTVQAYNKTHVLEYLWPFISFMFCVDAAIFCLPNLKASQFLILLVRIYLIWFNLIQKKFIKSWKDWWYMQSVTRKSFCECVECPALNKYCNQYQSSQAMHHLRDVITCNVYIVRSITTDQPTKVGQSQPNCRLPSS